MIPLKDQELIREKFAQEMTGPVKIDFFTEREVTLDVPGRRPCPYCKPAREMLHEISALSDLISLRVHIFDEAPPETAQFGIERIPATVLRGTNGAFVTFYGLPAGTEFPGFLESIVDISRREVLVSEESVKSLLELTAEVTLRVFVTPT